jgi:putative hydrolase of the HAD superfamily
MLMIKVIIFDLGGVCFDIDWIKINEEMIKKFNISTLVKSVGNEKAIEYYKEALEGKRHPKEMFKELNKENHDLDEVIKFYKEMYKKYKRHNPKIYKLLKKLKEKYILVCLSDTNSIHFEAHQEQETIKDFQKTFTSFQIGGIKRDSNTFQKVMNTLSVKPKEILFIDDHEKNIEVAKSVGIQTIKYIGYKYLAKELKSHKIAY